MPTSSVLDRYFSTLDESSRAVADGSRAAEDRRAYALADLAVRVAVDYAGRTLSDRDAASLAVLEEVVDETTATAANRALRACDRYPHHEVLVFAASATAQATAITPDYAKAGIEVGFYVARTVQRAGEAGRRLAGELVNRIR